MENDPAASPIEEAGDRHIPADLQVITKLSPHDRTLTQGRRLRQFIREQEPRVVTHRVALVAFWTGVVLLPIVGQIGVLVLLVAIPTWFVTATRRSFRIAKLRLELQQLAELSALEKNGTEPDEAIPHADSTVLDQWHESWRNKDDVQLRHDAVKPHSLSRAAARALLNECERRGIVKQLSDSELRFLESKGQDQIESIAPCVLTVEITDSSSNHDKPKFPRCTRCYSRALRRGYYIHEGVRFPLCNLCRMKQRAWKGVAIIVSGLAVVSGLAIESRSAELGGAYGVGWLIGCVMGTIAIYTNLSRAGQGKQATASSPNQDGARVFTFHDPQYARDFAALNHVEAVAIKTPVAEEKREPVYVTDPDLPARREAVLKMGGIVVAFGLAVVGFFTVWGYVNRPTYSLVQEITAPNDTDKYALFVYKNPNLDSWRNFFVYRLGREIDATQLKIHPSDNFPGLLFEELSRRYHQEKPSIRIVSGRYLVFSRGGLDHSLYDMRTRRLLVNDRDPQNVFRRSAAGQAYRESGRNDKLNAFAEWKSQRLAKRINAILDGSDPQARSKLRE